MNDEFDYMNQRLESNDRYRDGLNAEFMRLAAEPCMRPIKPGDRVLVAIGLLSRGHTWERQECEVLDVADTSVKVRSTSKDRRFTEWVNSILVTDVLGHGNGDGHVG